MESFACLYIIRGEPYRTGTCINLIEDETLIGRVSERLTPDFAFTNPFISRQHLAIRKEQDKAVLYDLGSRHGTEINGIRLTPHIDEALNMVTWKNFRGRIESCLKSEGEPILVEF